MIISVYKNEGETPLQALDRTRLEHGIEDSVPMTYAGRLDPLAEGLLLILTGEDVHKKDEYNGLSKVYEFTILFGVATDTGDILGKIVSEISEEKEYPPRKGARISLLRNRFSRLPDCEEPFQDGHSFSSLLKSFEGSYEQEYPLYSSKTVDGMPLWQYARENKIPEKIPTHKVKIESINFLGSEEKSTTDLEKEIVERITKVKGDFRQEEILNAWKEFCVCVRQDLTQDLVQNKFLLVNCVAEVSSGTYIRKLCEDIGKKLGTPALAWSIKRTKIGEMGIFDII